MLFRNRQGFIKVLSLTKQLREVLIFSHVTPLLQSANTVSALPPSLHPSQYLPRLWQGSPAMLAMVTTLPRSLNLQTGGDALTV